MTSGISVPTSQRTDSVYIRKTNRLMLFREMKHEVTIIRKSIFTVWKKWRFHFTAIDTQNYTGL